MVKEEKVQVGMTIASKSRYEWKKKMNELRKKGDVSIGPSGRMKFRGHR